MKIIYVADDGTQFDNQFECENYEWKINHFNLDKIHFFDKDNNELDDVFSEYTYINSNKIIVETIDAVKDLQDLGRIMGFCLYEYIDDMGEWEFDPFEKAFVKI